MTDTERQSPAPTLEYGKDTSDAVGINRRVVWLGLISSQALPISTLLYVFWMDGARWQDALRQAVVWVGILDLAVLLYIVAEAGVKWLISRWRRRAGS